MALCACVCAIYVLQLLTSCISELAFISMDFIGKKPPAQNVCDAVISSNGRKKNSKVNKKKINNQKEKNMKQIKQTNRINEEEKEK